MTVAYAIPAKKFLGLSTDTKPVPSATVILTAGDMFLETDTHFTYIWNMAAWVGPVYWLGQVYPNEETGFGY